MCVTLRRVRFGASGGRQDDDIVGLPEKLRFLSGVGQRGACVALDLNPGLRAIRHGEAVEGAAADEDDIVHPRPGGLRRGVTALMEGEGLRADRDDDLVGKLCRCPDSACAKPLVATLASLWGYFDSGSRLIAGARRRAAICQASAEYPSVRLARKWADQMCRCRDQACVTSTQSAANPLRKADRGTSLPPAVATKRDKHWARYSRCAARFPSK